MFTCSYKGYLCLLNKEIHNTNKTNKIKYLCGKTAENNNHVWINGFKISVKCSFCRKSLHKINANVYNIKSNTNLIKFGNSVHSMPNKRQEQHKKAKQKW